MIKASSCCGAGTYVARRKGRSFLMCKKCRTETTFQKRIVVRGVWKDVYQGQ